MLVDYSSMEYEISNALEPKIAPAGAQVQARIIYVREGISEKEGDYYGCKWYSITFDVPDDLQIKEFSKFFWELDKQNLPPKAFAIQLYEFQQFAKCFKIDYSRPFSWTDDLLGQKGWVILGVTKSRDQEQQNIIKKYLSA